MRMKAKQKMLKTTTSKGECGGGPKWRTFFFFIFETQNLWFVMSSFSIHKRRKDHFSFETRRKRESFLSVVSVSGATAVAGALTYIYTFSVRPLFASHAFHPSLLARRMFMIAYVCVYTFAFYLVGLIYWCWTEKRFVYINKGEKGERATFSSLHWLTFEITTDRTTTTTKLYG